MQIVDWNYNNEIIVPMLEDDDGNLFVLAKTAQAMLGLKQAHMSTLFYRHRDEFGPSNTVRVANEFIQLTENDFILFLTLSRTEVGKNMRKQFVQFIKEHAVRQGTTQMQHQIDGLHNEFAQIIEGMREELGLRASESGRTWLGTGPSRVNPPSSTDLVTSTGQHKTLQEGLRRPPGVCNNTPRRV